MPVKISIVVTTHDSVGKLPRAIDSIVGQSLPPREFELILVDDGSTDATPELIRTIADAHDNVSAEVIEHSGWPGRPRNVGLARARGEYVLFMDDDDELFPEALERMHDFARRNGSDVVLAKEVVEGGPTPGWLTWKENVDLVDRIDQRVLQCMTPHKLYRRQFLLDNDVRYPEGVVRLEDYNFNAQAYIRAQRISILADYPCYRWIIHDGNVHNRPIPFDIYWTSFEDSLRPVEQELPPGDARTQFLIRWYTSRILARLGPLFSTFTAEDQAELLGSGRRMLAHFPPEIDATLSSADRLRSRLLRRGDAPGLAALAALDTGCRLETRGSRCSWSAAGLTVTAQATLRDGSGHDFRVRRAGDRLVRVLPPGLTDGVDEADLDLTAEIAHAVAEFTVRGRSSSVEWAIPTWTHLSLVPEDGGDCAVTWNLRATIDPSTAALGHALPPDVWAVAARVDAFGLTARNAVAAKGRPALGALWDGQPAIAYCTVAGGLAVDTALTVRTVLGAAHPKVSDAWLDPEPGGLRLTIALPEIFVHGSTELAGEVVVDGAAHPATLTTHGDQARLDALLPAAAVTAPVDADLAFRFAGRQSPGPLSVRRYPDGTGRVIPRPTPPAAGTAPDPEPAVPAAAPASASAPVSEPAADPEPASGPTAGLRRRAADLGARRPGRRHRPS